jgi:surface protein
MPRFSVWSQQQLTKVTTLNADDAFVLATDTPEAKAIELEDLATELSGDVAFTGTYVAQTTFGTPALNDVFIVSQVSPLILAPLDQLQIALLATDMVLLVDTTAPSATTTFTLPLAGTVNVTVDWGDGYYDTYTTSGNKTHTYATSGQYRVRVQGSLTGFGATVSRPELVGCLSLGRLGITSLLSAFRLSANFSQCPKRIPNNVTTLLSAFNGATIFNDDISGWDTRNVTNTSSMFQGCTAFNQDIGGWDVSNVTTMNTMFISCTAFNQDIGGWDVSNVTDMATMFNGASAFNQDIGGWDVSNVTTMIQMLRNATAFNQDIGGWDVSNVTTMLAMFEGANAFQQPLNTWDFVGTVNLGSFMAGKTGANSYNTTDYDNLLVRWDELVTATTLDASRTVNMGGAKYTDPGAGATARAALVTAGWTIVDGGAA